MPTTLPDGRELWRVVERKQHSASTRPVFGHGLCYFPTGFGKGQQLLAVDPNGKNDTTETHIKWRLARSGVPEKPSLLLVGNHLYMVDDQGGLATCVDAKSEKKFGANDWAAIIPHLRLWPTAGFMPLARKENPSSLPLPRKGFKKLPKTNSPTALWLALPCTGIR